jgi:hypothetical protein
VTADPCPLPALARSYDVDGPAMSLELNASQLMVEAGRHVSAKW